MSTVAGSHATAAGPLVYDPYAYGIHEDPYPTYARLRDEAPLYHNDERGFWALSRHTDVLAAFRDSDRFSNAEGVSIDPAASGPHAHRTMSFLAMDPPQHGRMRGLVSRAFTPRRVAAMEDRIRSLTVHHLTTKLLAHAWYWAWANPDERCKAFGQPARTADWVEETLRYDTSSQMLARVTKVDVALHGRVVPAGDRVLLLAGSANRDPRAFADPDRFDLDRDREAGIASFGVGRHFCLGASLARLEARVVLEELVARVHDYDIDAAGACRVHSVNVRGFETLPTTVVPR